MSKKTIPQDPSVRSLGGLGGRRRVEPEPATDELQELELDPGRFTSDQSTIRMQTCVACGQPMPSMELSTANGTILTDLHLAKGTAVRWSYADEESQFRALLVELCRRGRVKQDDWTSQNSSKNQRQLAECGALLEAGCRFDLGTGSADLYRLDVFFRGWGWYGFDSEDGEGEKTESFIIPTAEKLAEVGGRDWSP